MVAHELAVDLFHERRHVGGSGAALGDLLEERAGAARIDGEPHDARRGRQPRRLDHVLVFAAEIAADTDVQRRHDFLVALAQGRRVPGAEQPAPAHAPAVGAAVAAHVAEIGAGLQRHVALRGGEALALLGLQVEIMPRPLEPRDAHAGTRRARHRFGPGRRIGRGVGADFHARVAELLGPAQEVVALGSLLHVYRKCLAHRV